jgi:hypothetical protein
MARALFIQDSPPPRRPPLRAAVRMMAGWPAPAISPRQCSLGASTLCRAKRWRVHCLYRIHRRPAVAMLASGVCWSAAADSSALSVPGSGGGMIRGRRELPKPPPNPADNAGRVAPRPARAGERASSRVRRIGYPCSLPQRTCRAASRVASFPPSLRAFFSFFP